MLERFLITLLPLIFLGSFIIRNLGIKRRTGMKIRAVDPLVTASFIITTLCIITTICAVYWEIWYGWMVPIPLLHHPLSVGAGMLLLVLAILLGWIFSGQLKTAWRVGVHSDQQTELIQNGVYAYIRNPYFSTYFMMFSGLFLVRPSLVAAIIVSAAGTIFHRMVLKEEAHLEHLHGVEYARYKAKAGRYLPKR